jgi:hypothetical protein
VENDGNRMLATQSGCFECDRLWREYEAATRESFNLESKLQLATLSQDGAVVTVLLPAVQMASERRGSFRQELLRHIRDVHQARVSAAGAAAVADG